MDKRNAFKTAREVLGSIKFYKREEKKQMNAPVHKLKSGKVSMTAWQGNYGVSWTLGKNYYDKQTSTWKDSKSLYAADLPDVMEVVKQAMRIMEADGTTIARSKPTPPPPPPQPPAEDELPNQSLDDDDIPF